MALALFSRRTFIWRYCIIASFLVYILSMGAFIPLLSSTPKTRLDFADPVSVTELAVATRNHSPPAVSVPATAGLDGRRPLGVGAAAADAIVSTKPTKKPTALEVLHKNMTLHKANMSDLLKHVKAAVANRTDNTSLRNRTVNSTVNIIQLMKCTQVRAVYSLIFFFDPSVFTRRSPMMRLHGQTSSISFCLLRIFNSPNTCSISLPL